MTKEQFLSKLQDLYRVANKGDTNDADRPAWLKPSMASNCRLFDTLLTDMVDQGVISSEERQDFYSDL